MSFSDTESVFFDVALLSEILQESPFHIMTIYTPGIYADGYIVFAFPFVHSSVRMFLSSFVRSFVEFSSKFALKFLKWCISQQLHIRKHSYSDHSYP